MNQNEGGVPVRPIDDQPIEAMERDRSQIPLWPELERELERSLDEQHGDPTASAPGAGAEPAEVDSFSTVEAVTGIEPANESSSTPRADAAITTGMQDVPVPESDAAAAAPGLDARGTLQSDPDLELAMRLRAARERAGLSRAEVARLTHIAPTLLDAIEEGRFGRLGAGVFARGYLRSYARAVGVPEAVVEVWEGRSRRVPESVPGPSLAAASPRRSTRQVAHPIMYTLLTALIAIPAYYGVRQAQHSPLQDIRAATADVTRPSPARERPGTSETAGTPAVDPPGNDSLSPATPPASPTAVPTWQQPVMASLTPMLGATRAGSAPSPVDMRRVELRLSAPSWIEIVSADDEARVFERRLLPAGSVQEYSLPRSARFRIGDADAVELRADGRVIDLVPFTRANVATLTLEEADS